MGAMTPKMLSHELETGPTTSGLSHSVLLIVARMQNHDVAISEFPRSPHFGSGLADTQSHRLLLRPANTTE